MTEQSTRYSLFPFSSHPCDSCGHYDYHATKIAAGQVITICSYVEVPGCDCLEVHGLVVQHSEWERLVKIASNIPLMQIMDIEGA